MGQRRPPLNGILSGMRHGLLLVPLLFLAVFFFYPLATILAIGLVPEGTIDLSSFVEIISSDYYRRIIGFTVGQATLSTALTLALALPGAYVFARYEFPLKRMLLSLSVLPFILPTLVVSAAFTALLGRTGIINILAMSVLGLAEPPVALERTFAIILIAHIFYNYPLALRMISSFWVNQSPQIEEAARLLGCYGWRLWWFVRIPLLRPIILASGLLIFVFTFTSFGVILILGGPRFATLEVEIFRQTTSYLNLSMAAALSLIQMGLLFALMAVYARLQSQIASELQASRLVSRKPNKLSRKLLVAANLGLMGLLLFVPLAALVIRSLTLGESGLTLRYYAALAHNPRGSILFVPPIEAVGNSLLFATGTMLVAVLLGLLTAQLLTQRWRIARWLDPLFMLPLAASAATLGFGYIVALDEPPLNLRTSPALLLIAHTLVALPFVVRSVLPAIRGIPEHIREAAKTLGASPWQVWRLIDLPLIGRGLAVGATFAFTVSMGEFGASVFVTRPEIPTIPIAIYRLLGQPGIVNYGQALALSVLLMVVCGISFSIIERLRVTGVGEF